MKAFLVLTLAALSQARPEPPSGYNYPQPQSSYLPSSGGHGGGISSSSFGGHSSLGIGGGSGFDGGYAGGYSSYSHAPIVQKHIYVHVPPPEPIEHHIHRIPEVAPPQKHYKIIFIKAPTPPTPTVPIIPLQPQNEEKTLVYVLVKKPEAQPDIIIPQAIPTPPSKPEVYFIKYRTQQEGGGIGGGLGLGGGLGGGIGGGLGGGLGGGIGGGLGGLGGGLGGIEGGIGGGFGGDDIGLDGAGSGGHGGGSFSSSSSSSFSSVSHGSGASSQYGPPNHAPGPLH